MSDFRPVLLGKIQKKSHFIVITLFCLRGSDLAMKDMMELVLLGSIDPEGVFYTISFKNGKKEIRLSDKKIPRCCHHKGLWKEAVDVFHRT